MAICSICKSRIGETFLKKIKGGIVKDEKGKKHLVCNNCQSKFPAKEELLKSLR